MKVLITVCIFLTMTVLMVGCSKPQNAIVGKWHATGHGRGTMQFLKDGTVLIGGVRSEVATYTFPDDQHLKLDYGNGQVTVWGYRMDGDKMFMTNESVGNAKPAELDRVKD